MSQPAVSTGLSLTIWALVISGVCLSPKDLNQRKKWVWLLPLCPWAVDLTALGLSIKQTEF